MTKVWEEEWYSDDANVRRMHEGESDGFEVFEGRYPSGDEAARAELASAAPDMARTLLALEWAGYNDVVGPHCTACDVVRYSEWSVLNPPGNETMGSYIARVPGDNDHKPDCELVAALRKAGVR